jgi:hypothetical protein
MNYSGKNPRNVVMVTEMLQDAKRAGIKLDKLSDEEIAQDIIRHTGMESTVHEVASCVRHHRGDSGRKPKGLRRVFRWVLWGVTIWAAGFILHTVFHRYGGR